MIVFKAKTNSGYVIKILTELLQHNIKTACFEIDKNGIKLRMMDYHRTVLLDVDLKAENFMVFKFKNKEKMFVGINLNHFHRMIRSIKKKDSIQFFIDDDDLTELGFKVIPKENNRKTTSYIKIQDIQHLDIDLPDGYTKSVLVPASQFQKMCKEMLSISKEIVITSTNKSNINFMCNQGGILKRNVVFGDIDDSSDELSSDEEEENSERFFKECFDTSQLCRITKLAGLCSNIQIYLCKDKPIMFKTKIGDLGVISIFIKCKRQVEQENYNTMNK